MRIQGSHYKNKLSLLTKSRTGNYEQYAEKLRFCSLLENRHIHMIHSKGYDSFTSSKYERRRYMVTGMS